MRSQYHDRQGPVGRTLNYNFHNCLKAHPRPHLKERIRLDPSMTEQEVRTYSIDLGK